MSDRNIVLAFDAYGTLLSTESIAKKLASHFGEDRANAVAAKWRLYQLEYTWRANSMNMYEPFSSITRKSLRHALKEQGLWLDEDDVKGVMSAYDSLSTFPDVKPALDAIVKERDLTCVVFSQGTYAMVSASVNKSPDLGPYAAIFKDIVVVEEVRKFKPAPETYDHLVQKLGRQKGDFDGLWLVSGNPFDIVGSRAMGMNAVWVDRAGTGWMDSLGEPNLRPSIIVKSLGEVVAKVRAYESASGNSARA
ncbi:haloacid dehalogenase, type II [Verruconis gallopava]|uniref:Haloacid dehalogenase, type II n=1 Tax=Verruconis gallopava TaxID=253628 RepID=A0A0D2A2A3_9PEZI|nr:haloacid dehalogenase, type II [Verruconis gallopava]KIW00888.1 haloacid dehalogenase, type II [Verruconis gallopava]